MNKILVALIACAVECAANGQVARAQTERIVYSFCSLQNCADGERPAAGVIKVGNKLYGTTGGGGNAGNDGTIYSLHARDGAVSVQHVFGKRRDGYFPQGNLIRFRGTLYGTTVGGGRHGDGGTVFAVSPATGVEKVLHSFASLGSSGDGSEPLGALVSGKGMLYGTTQNGGSGRCSQGCGTVFSINPQTRSETVLYSFQQNSLDGALPRTGLIRVNDTLYGTTYAGGGGTCFNGGGCGTVFSLNLKTGAETILHFFQYDGTDGTSPEAALIDVNGTLYGTTSYGGSGTCYDGCGTVFSINPANNAETVLYSFQNNGADGIFPEAALIDVGGMLYGTTEGGGAYGDYGTVFSIDLANNAETVLHSFQNNDADGSEPLSSLFNVSGTLYGTTASGGAHGGGTVFSIAP